MGRDILTSIQMHNSGNLVRKSNCGKHYKDLRINMVNDMKIFIFYMRYETFLLFTFKKGTLECPRLKPGYGESR